MNKKTLHSVIRRTLEKNDGRCLDSSEERTIVARAITKAVKEYLLSLPVAQVRRAGEERPSPKAKAFTPWGTP